MMRVFECVFLSRKLKGGCYLDTCRSEDGSDRALDARGAPRGATSTQRMTLYATGQIRSKSVKTSRSQGRPPT